MLKQIHENPNKVPTTDQLMVTIAAELEFPSMRRLDDPMYVPPTKLTGSQLSEIGQQMSINHADEVLPNWSNAAYQMVCQFVKAYGSQPFKAETVREWSIEMGLPTPPSLRSFGAVFTKAKNEGIIRAVGYTQVTNKKAHAANCRLWVRN